MPERTIGHRGITPTRLLAVYLLATTPLIVMGGVTDGSAVWMVGHLAVLTGVCLLEWRARGGELAGGWEVVRSWIPLMVVPLLYGELPHLMEGVWTGYHDPAIQGIERVLFGGQPSAELAGMVPWVGLSEVLHAAYLAYYPIIYVPPLFLFLKGRRADFHASVTAVIATFIACYVVFIFFPVQGPRYIWVPEGIPQGPVRSLVLTVLEGGSSRGAAFPSSHVAVAVAQTRVMLRVMPGVGRLLAGVTVALALGAIYGGFHYAFDAVIGAMVGVAVVAALDPSSPGPEDEGR
ncbi:MAG: phosphatase PAP2 family protein [Gemmatimonadota bacterium]|nr:phosphatase PAP2 family protein [Gemmatimonadota bacterium]MDH5760058.1 phosphatase PAP2 family protein [Gemmatimonadota bacterium]